MFKNKLIDLHAEIDMPRHPYTNDLELQAILMEDDAKDLTAFLKDHRSRDSYNVRIVREYKRVCGFCGWAEERDTDGTPLCCQKAIDEFQAEQSKKAVAK